MSEVKRYDGKIKHVGDGGYVSYTDYAELKAQRDALAAENASIKASVDTHAAGFSVCPVCSHEEPSETDDIVWMVKETPATDAYLNSVRAEGVEMFALYLAETAIKEGADLTGWKSTASNEACDYAAQLRAGEPS